MYHIYIPLLTRGDPSNMWQVPSVCDLLIDCLQICISIFFSGGLCTDHHLLAATKTPNRQTNRRHGCLIFGEELSKSPGFLHILRLFLGHGFISLCLICLGCFFFKKHTIFLVVSDFARRYGIVHAVIFFHKTPESRWGIC